MPIATKDFDAPMRPDNCVCLFLEPGQKAFGGTMAAFDSAGDRSLFVEASDTAGLIVLGRVESYVENPAFDLDGNPVTENKMVTIRRRGAFGYLTDESLTRADLFSRVFVVDSSTVSKNDPGNGVIAGELIALEVCDGRLLAFVEVEDNPDHSA